MKVPLFLLDPGPVFKGHDLSEDLLKEELEDPYQQSRKNKGKERHVQYDAERQNDHHQEQYCHRQVPERQNSAVDHRTLDTELEAGSISKCKYAVHDLIQDRVVVYVEHKSQR